MADKFKELFEEARNSGVDHEWVDRFETTFEASGLRKDNQAIKERYQTVAEQNAKLRHGMLKDRFSQFGITISPSILNIPEDLDPSDPEKVQSWAEEMGLITKTETTPPAERATHDRIANATNEGAGSVTLPPITPDMTEEEFWAQAQAREAAIKNKTH